VGIYVTSTECLHLTRGSCSRAIFHSTRRKEAEQVAQDEEEEGEERPTIGKRDLLQRQKSPITEAKETYYRGKRDLLQRQKRPITEAKETYFRGKRDLL
jgi:hypothetical protein